KDPFLHMAALFWQGDTHVYCYRQPEEAIPIFKEGLSYVNSDAPLFESALFVNLAIAYAQRGDETEALKMVAQARNAIAQDAEQDPYQYIQMGHGILDTL